MLQFKDIELTDKEWVCELLSYSDYNSTEYNFTVLFLWKHYYNTKICSDDITLIAPEVTIGKGAKIGKCSMVTENVGTDKQ